VGNPEAGNRLDEAVDTETEKGETLVGGTEPCRDQPLDDIIDDGKNGESVRRPVESPVSGGQISLGDGFRVG